jgi:ribosome-binding factor A
MSHSSKNRKERLGNQVREIIAQCLLFEVKDPGVRSLNITDVELSGDLSHAKVYYYGHNLDERSIKSAERALERVKGFLRRRLGQEIRSRVTPDLFFFYDDSFERGIAIDQLISKALSEDTRKATLYRDSNPLEESLEETEGAENGDSLEQSDSSATEGNPDHETPDQ